MGQNLLESIHTKVRCIKKITTKVGKIQELLFEGNLLEKP